MHVPDILKGQNCRAEVGRKWFLLQRICVKEIPKQKENRDWQEHNFLFYFLFKVCPFLKPGKVTTLKWSGSKSFAPVALLGMAWLEGSSRGTYPRCCKPHGVLGCLYYVLHRCFVSGPHLIAVFRTITVMKIQLFQTCILVLILTYSFVG